uniref:Uncharacterized protein n=1 Tax=Eutreptiella gymnastica TaxID=73025 RepID=A0A7S1JH60_9EUGL|mmetsp:Transcript_9683/g.17041  ORF Transcript_9683/g.17041 Transcript_9683/m.17041 type:complete len:386 (+) Transcript_9683:49-1206(+)
MPKDVGDASSIGFPAWGFINLHKTKIHPFPSAIIPLPWSFYLEVVQRLLDVCKSANTTFNFLNQKKQQLSETYQGEKASKEERKGGNAAGNSGLYNYHDEQQRLSYFVFFVPNHAAMLCEALLKVGPHVEHIIDKALKKRKPLVVTSFGGGPVSDLLGFLMYLTSVGKQHEKMRDLHIVFHVLDLKDWEPLWPHVQDAIGSYFPHVQVVFKAVDLTQDRATDVVPTDTMLCLFSHFIVEMVDYATSFGKFFADLVSQLKSRACLLFLDPVSANGEYQAKELTQQMLDRSSTHLSVRLARTIVTRDSKQGMPIPSFKIVDPSTLWGFHIQQSRLLQSYKPIRNEVPSDPVVIYPKTRGGGRGGVELWRKRKTHKRKRDDGVPDVCN